MNDAIKEFISIKNIAVVGYSRNKNKFGNHAYKELKQKGFEVFAVHPTEHEIEGVKCYPSLDSIKNNVNGVFISVNAKEVPKILIEASSLGLKNIWLQQGAESQDAIKTADELGLKMVSGKCILMYAPPVNSIHRIHRAFAKLFGKY